MEELLRIIRYQQEINTKKLVSWNTEWRKVDKEAFVMDIAKELRELGLSGEFIEERLLECYRWGKRKDNKK